MFNNTIPLYIYVDDLSDFLSFPLPCRNHRSLFKVCLQTKLTIKR